MSALVIALAAAGCSTKASGHHFNGPAVAPLVRDATPSGLRPSATAHNLPSPREILEALSPIRVAHAGPPPDVNSSILALFKDPYAKVSGGQSQGIINSALEDLDTRMASVDAQGTTGSCLTASPSTHSVDLSAIAPALKLDLAVQCSGAFPTGGLSGAGSGIVFGNKTASGPVNDGGVVGKDYSLWLYLRSSTSTDGFGYFANVLDAGSPGKSVDFMFLENNLVESSRIEVYRVKAKPSTQEFEFVYGSTTGGAPATQNLKCGFRMISDGAFIWAEGKDAQPGQDCSAAAAFTRCFKASDVSDQSTTTSCDTLKTKVTMIAPTQAQLAAAGVGDAINAALPVSAAAHETTPF